MSDINIVLEEKGVGDHSNIEYMDSFEERVNSVFFDDCSEEYSDRYGQSDDHDSQDPEERTLYWESQHSLLQEVLERYSSTGSKLRKEISGTIDMAREAGGCCCHCAAKPKINGYCLRRQVVDMLRDKGIDATLSTSKWRDTKKFPRGSHEFIEVIGSTSSRKKQVHYILEVEFREQFEIAKPCREYQKILSELPEYYIGKPDYLYAIVRIVCDAAKTSMKKRKIHMGPWRKTSFMLMKWSANSVIDQKLKFSESYDKFRPISPPARELRSQFSVAPPAVVVT